MIGRSLGHYRLLEKLGAGGMGEVYLADDCRLHRHVALKILPPERSLQPKNLERFQREARLVAALNHPSIVTIHSVEEHEGLHFLTMELVQGATLAEVIPPEGLPLRRLLEIASPLADALTTAHAQGIVHRDLKPANVMVSPEWRVKILDFGIAKFGPDREATVVDGEGIRDETLTGPGLVLGTPAYMSPEQILGQPVDHRTDLFSFGTLLFQMATGRRPFSGNGSNETLAAVLRDTPPRPSSLNSQIPAELDNLVERCLEKEPIRRVQSAREILESLQALMTSLSASKPLVVIEIEPARGRRRWRPAVEVFGVSVCVAVLAFAMATSRLPGLPETPLRLASPSESMPNPRPSLAVLPLGNFSKDPEYFVDGMTDALIASLSDLQGVRVISRQSVMRFKESSAPLPEIARKLGVDMIVQGSVMRADGQVRITAQLIRADPEQQIWGRSYERDFRDVLALQKEVAEAISQEIQVRLEPASRRAAVTQPVNPEAYDAYLRGRFALNLRTKVGFATALESFQEALRRNPTFAIAHAGLAELHCVTAQYGLAEPAEAYRQARLHAQSALKIDPDLVDAHVSLGLVQMFANRDWDGAEASFRRAIALRPNHPEVHHYYAINLLARGGRWAEAMEHLRLHLELDPLSPSANANVGVRAYLERRPAEALQFLQKAQALAPDLDGIYFDLSSFYRLQGNPEKDFEHLRKALALRYPQILPAVDEAFRKGGRPAALKAAAEALENELAILPNLPPEDIASIYVRLGKRAKAVDCLEESYRRGFAGAVFFDSNRDWEWNTLRTEPRFRALIQRIRQSPNPWGHEATGASMRQGCTRSAFLPEETRSTDRRSR